MISATNKELEGIIDISRSRKPKAGRDLSGMKFGKLTAVRQTQERVDRYYVWECHCDCGGVCFVNTKKLVRGTITNCGCIPKKTLRNGNHATNLTGLKFGSLTVLSRAPNKDGRVCWHCKCDCGNEVTVRSNVLRSGKAKSCGCIQHRGTTNLNLTGMKIGMLTVIEPLDSRDDKGSVIWLCKCECGKEKTYSADALMHGGIVSCGCYRENVLPNLLNSRLHRIDGTCLETLLRKKARSDSKTGIVGVHLTKNGSYTVSITLKGKRYYLGTYKELEDAINARSRGEELHRQFIDQYYAEHGNDSNHAKAQE